MEVTNLLSFSERNQLRAWFEANHQTETCCWVACNRSKQPKPDTLFYIDIVEEALCFGWIDSTLRNIDGVLIQRFSPRKKKSHWTQTNINRCIELNKKGLMQEDGMKECPYFNK